MATPPAWVQAALQRIAGTPRIAPLVAVYRGAPTVRPARRLAVSELLRRDDLAYYELRENGLTVAIRHGAAAVWVLAEIFGRHCYEPPGEAARALGRPKAILDLGANIGLFGLFAAGRWPEASIVGFEPDPKNTALHELTLAANDLGDRWQLVQSAASVADGRLSFVGGQNAVSRMAEDIGPGEQPVDVPAVDVLDRIAGADLVKVDIEGGEWAILADRRFGQSPPRVMVLEFHPHGCPGERPRELAEQALRLAGLKVQVTEDRGDGHGVLWAWRP